MGLIAIKNVMHTDFTHGCRNTKPDVVHSFYSDKLLMS